MCIFGVFFLVLLCAHLTSFLTKLFTKHIGRLMRSRMQKVNLLHKFAHTCYDVDTETLVRRY